MEFVVILIGILLLSVGFWFKSKKPNYQVEKTTLGSFVRFLDYEEAKRYKRNRMIGVILILGGTAIILAGIAMLVLLEK